MEVAYSHATTSSWITTAAGSATNVFVGGLDSSGNVVLGVIVPRTLAMPGTSYTYTSPSPLTRGVYWFGNPSYYGFSTVSPIDITGTGNGARTLV